MQGICLLSTASASFLACFGLGIAAATMQGDASLVSPLDASLVSPVATASPELQTLDAETVALEGDGAAERLTRAWGMPQAALMLGALLAVLAITFMLIQCFRAIGSGKAGDSTARRLAGTGDSDNDQCEVSVPSKCAETQQSRASCCSTLVTSSKR